MRVMLSLSDIENASLSKIVRDDTSFPLEFADMNKDFKVFKDAIVEVIESNLDLLDEVPLAKHLNKEKLREFFEKQIKSDLEKDPLFEKSVEISKYARNMYELMDSYFGEIFDYYQQQQKRLSLDLFSLSKMFLNSDLPMPFATSLENSILAEKDYIEIYVRKIREERLSLMRYRNNRLKFQRVCDSHNRWVNRFWERLDAMDRERVKLIWYFDFNNSRSLNEIFKDKFIKTSLLDKQILSNFLNLLLNQVYEVEKLNASMMKPSSFLPFEFDDGTRAIRKIMQILR